MAPPGLDTVDPVQAALSNAFAGLQSTGAQGPTPPAAAQALPTVAPATAAPTQPPAAPPTQPPVEMATPEQDNPVPPAGAAPPVGSQPAQELVGGDDDATIQAGLLKNFDINIEDIVPKDILDKLHETSRGGMSLSDALGISAIAVTQPELAGQLLLQHEREKYAATNSLINVATQVGSAKKEAARQVAMYMRARSDQRAGLTKQQEKIDAEAYAKRRGAATAFEVEVRKAGLPPEDIGVPPLTEDILQDPVKFANWSGEASNAAAKAKVKNDVLMEVAGMKQYGPAAAAAKTGVDPTSAVNMLLKKTGYSDEEIASLQPMVKGFAASAKRAGNAILAETDRKVASASYMTGLSNKTLAEIKKIEAELGGGVTGLKREKALQYYNTISMLDMTAQGEFLTTQNALQLELRKPTQEEALARAGDYLPFNELKPEGVQNPQYIEALQVRLSAANEVLMRSAQIKAQLAPIASGEVGTMDLNLALQDVGPKLAEASRSAVLGGKALPPGLAPEVRAEAQAAATDPATWLGYLKMPPIGPDGQPNPVRTAYWAAVVRNIGYQMGGAQTPEDIIKLLDVQSAGQPSYADIYAGQDITLPAQPIEQMMGSLQPGQAPAGKAGPAPAQPRKP